MAFVRSARQSRVRAVHRHRQRRRCVGSGEGACVMCRRSRTSRESGVSAGRSPGGRELRSRLHELNGERMRRSARDVRAQSFLGVGAPEAVLVGVTALLVFGPKGLADVVKNAGKALRAFQPAIKELQEVSTELKDTLGDQMGLKELEEIGRTAQQLSRGEMPTTLTSTMDDDEDIEEMRRKSAAQAWGSTPSAPVAATTSEESSDGDEAEAEAEQERGEGDDKTNDEDKSVSSPSDSSLESSSSSPIS